MVDGHSGQCYNCWFGSLSGQASFHFIFPQSLVADFVPMSSPDITNSWNDTYKPDLFLSDQTFKKMGTDRLLT